MTKKPKNHSMVIKLAFHNNGAGENPVNDTLSCLISLMNDSLTLLQGNFFPSTYTSFLHLQQKKTFDVSLP